MAWRLAGSLDQLRTQVQAAWPTRSRRSDGTIGDASHQKRTSDHNPWVPPPRGGVVTALDITHDPAAGADMHALAVQLITDPRTKYVIWDGRIWSSKHAKRGWRTYTGSNPHKSHLHISVHADAPRFDSRRPWPMPGVRGFSDMQQQVIDPEEEHIMRPGAKNAQQFQHLLNRLIARTGGGLDGGGTPYEGGRHLKVDGDFGPRTAEFYAEALRRAQAVLGHPTYGDPNVVTPQTEMWLVLACDRAQVAVPA